MARKRGKLSTDEEKFIRENIGKLSVDNIAVQLNRTTKTVENFCSKNNLTFKGMSEEIFDDNLLRAKLETRPYWEEVKRQFSERELQYFATTWVEMIKQFREDILYSEELQVKQWITLEIMGNKVMQDRKASQEQIDRLSVLLANEYAVAEDIRDAGTIAQLETELSNAKMVQGTHTNEHGKILEKIEKIQRDLKAARSDRVKKIEDSKSSWSGLMKYMQEPENRRKLGEEIEIIRLAMEHRIAELSKFHKYEDGQVDQPFLTPDTARDE